MSLLLLFDRRFGDAVGGIDRGGIKHRPATLNVSYYKKKVKDKEVVELKSTQEFDKKKLKNKVSPKIAKLLSDTMVIADDATPTIAALNDAIRAVEKQKELEEQIAYLTNLKEKHEALQQYLEHEMLEKLKKAQLDKEMDQDMELILMLIQ